MDGVILLPQYIINAINQGKGMAATLIDGKKAAISAEVAIKVFIKEHYAKQGFKPKLAVVMVGNDAASAVYVGRKMEACKRVGIDSTHIQLESHATEEELLAEIWSLNQDVSIHGILVQLPLPSQIRSDLIIQAIHPEKDIDGFHPQNLGALAARMPAFRPCTPFGIMHLLRTIAADLRGMRAVVIGASNIVGRPMALELLLAGCTVTICHRFTKNLQEEALRADILVTAVGKAGLVKGDMVKEGAIVIDVGMTRLENGRLVGDVFFDEVVEKASWLTPVPGGVGPMTVAMLLANTCQAAYGINPIK